MTTPGQLDPDGLDLTAEEVAKILRTSSRTVRRWAKDGKIPGAWQLHTDKWLFPQKGLIAYKAKNAK